MKKSGYMLILPMLLALVLGVTGCSSDESNDNSPISTVFLLQDEAGSEKSNFNEGENIIFRLDIINNSNEEIVLPSLVEITGNDIFHVYSSKGEDFGKPYDVLILPEIAHTLLPPKSRVSLLCPWVNSSDSVLSYDPHYLNSLINKLRPLPKGDYYSEFNVKLNDNRIVTCNKTFKIN